MGYSEGRVRVTKSKMLFGGPCDSIEKVRINHAKYTKIYHTNNLISLIQLYELKYDMNSPNDGSETEF
jgi:hypothetical protein